MADGGPGFVDVLHASLGGDLLATTVPGPYGDEVPGSVLVHDAHGVRRERPGLRAAPHPRGERRPEAATTYGVGQLIGQAVEAGARRVLVGLGGSATNDGGAGLLAGLGATSPRRPR